MLLAVLTALPTAGCNWLVHGVSVGQGKGAVFSGGHDSPASENPPVATSPMDQTRHQFGSLQPAGRKYKRMATDSLLPDQMKKRNAFSDGATSEDNTQHGPISLNSSRARPCPYHPEAFSSGGLRET